MTREIEEEEDVLKHHCEESREEILSPKASLPESSSGQLQKMPIIFRQLQDGPQTGCGYIAQLC